MNFRGWRFCLGSFFIADIKLAIPTRSVPSEVSTSAMSDIFISSSFLYINYITYVIYCQYFLSTFLKIFYAIMKIMNYLKKFDNFPDFDYFSRNYRQFESDFHELSALKVPLTFLTDDIRATMRASGDTFFILDAANCKEMVKIRFDFELIDGIYTYKGYVRLNGKYE